MFTDESGGLVWIVCVLGAAVLVMYMLAMGDLP